MADDWKSYAKRQLVVNQIDEYLRHTQSPINNPGVANIKSGQELENSLFHKATKKEDYMQYVSKTIKFLKDQIQNTNQNNSNLNAMLGGQSQQVARAPIGQNVNSGVQMVHTNQPQMAVNQAQMVHAGNSGAQMAHGNTSGGQMTHTGVAGNQGMMQGTILAAPGRMNQLMPGNMPNQGEMVNWQSQPKRRGPNDMMIINVNAKHPGMGNINQMPSQAAKMGAMTMPLQGHNEQVNQITVGGQIPGRGGLTMQPRVPSPSFSVGSSVLHPRQGTPTPSGASPVSQQHQMSHNTINFVSPSPSPANAGGGGRGMNQIGAPSPGGMINTPGQPHTPGQPQQQTSPANGSLEDRAYMEKVKELRLKYLDTLRGYAQQFDNSDSESARKMRNFLEIIENPHRRAPRGMETLKACENVLERLGIQHREPRKDDPVVLFDAINFALKSPIGYHTIHRTLSPALKTLLGPDFDYYSPKKLKLEEPTIDPSENPVTNDLVQGEIARLPPRFKVNLDSQHLSGSDDLIICCQLDDPNLPCVPPISLIIPPSYPKASPQCRLSKVEYDTTDFLKKVREIMTCRQFNLPELCSITMILDTWEMSVRRACSPKPFTPDAINPLINLNLLS